MTDESRIAWGYGLVISVVDGVVEGWIFDIWFFLFVFGALVVMFLLYELFLMIGMYGMLSDCGVCVDVVLCEIDLDAPFVVVFDVYLRLHLLLYWFVVFNIINFEGIFGVLLNVVWISVGLCVVEGFEIIWMRLCRKGMI